MAEDQDAGPTWRSDEAEQGRLLSVPHADTANWAQDADAHR